MKKAGTAQCVIVGHYRNLVITSHLAYPALVQLVEMLTHLM